MTHNEALAKIRSIHTKLEGPSGTTDGSCAECGWTWPCLTYHVAAGWGDSFHECAEQSWCAHEGVPL